MISICIMGARSGSKSITNKNIQEVEKKSLIRISLEKAIRSNIFDKIYLSTDSLDYIKEVDDLTQIECILRPEELSRDNSFEFDYIIHVLKEKNINDGNLISRMQCTSPFQSIKSMKKCLSLMKQNSCYSSVQIVTETQTSVYKSMTFKNNTKQLQAAHPEGSISPSNRQAYSKTYFRSNFYCFRSENIINGDLLGNNCFGVVGENRESIDIDNKFDIELVRALAKINPEWLIV